MSTQAEHHVDRHLPSFPDDIHGILLTELRDIKSQQTSVGQDAEIHTYHSGYVITKDLNRPLGFDVQVKLGEDPLLVKKVVLTPQHSDIRMFTPPMEFGILQLQFAIGYDWSKRSFAASWRSQPSLIFTLFFNARYPDAKQSGHGDRDYRNVLG